MSFSVGIWLHLAEVRYETFPLQLYRYQSACDNMHKMRVFDTAALLKVSWSVEELLLTMADSKVWENARESGRLDDKVARSVLTGYLAAVDWPANFWHR